MTDDGCGENSTWTQLLEGISPPLFHFHARKDHLLPTLAKRNGGLHPVVRTAACRYQGVFLKIMEFIAVTCRKCKVIFASYDFP